MSKPTFSFGASLAKKPGASKPPPGKRKRAFGADDDSDDSGGDVFAAAGSKKASATRKLPPPGTRKPVAEEAITELDGFADATISSHAAADDDADRRKPSKHGGGLAPHKKPGPPPSLKERDGGGSNPLPPVFGSDLSSALTSRRHAEAAVALDPSVFDYDGVYDSLKAAGKARRREQDEPDAATGERKARYMDKFAAAAAVRKRDGLIAEEKRLAREREAEGDEYAGTESFVTEGYKRQQEENRRIEEEERRREEAEAEAASKAPGGKPGMGAFYKKMLEREEHDHAQTMRAVEERRREGPEGGDAGADGEDSDQERDKREAELAHEINARGGEVAINDDGQVVDRRQLLRGGLNAAPARKKQPGPSQITPSSAAGRGARPSDGPVGPGGGGRHSQRERQSRAMEAQLEARLRASREAEEAEERRRKEAADKGRKSAAEVQGARERYLARKKAEAEAKAKEKEDGGGEA